MDRYLCGGNVEKCPLHSYVSIPQCWGRGVVYVSGGGEDH